PGNRGRRGISDSYQEPPFACPVHWLEFPLQQREADSENRHDYANDRQRGDAQCPEERRVSFHCPPLDEVKFRLRMTAGRQWMVSGLRRTEFRISAGPRPFQVRTGLPLSLAGANFCAMVPMKQTTSVLRGYVGNAA